jgi:NADPH:quinone reductase-like Zn-dependent oxidoreductase
MKAAICTNYGNPNVLLIKKEKKTTPKNNEVLIKIHAANVSISDCIVRSGRVSFWLWLPMRIFVGFKRPRNSVLGLELAGEIEKIGSDVTRFKPGDKIIAFTGKKFGAYAEYVCLPVNGTFIPTESVIIEKPAIINWNEAAAIPTRATLALHYLQQANIRKGQKVLVFGASGGVGTFAVQLAKYFGANVIAVCSTSNLELVKSLGADKVIDYTKEDFTKSNELFDVIFDAVGKKYSANLQYRKVLDKDGKFISVDDGNPKIHIDSLLEIIKLIEESKLKVILDKAFTLEQIIEAHKYVEAGHKTGGVVVTMS